MIHINRPLKKIWDLTGLLALLLFALSIWHAMPHPKWRVPLKQPDFGPIGFSPDGQYCITASDGWIEGNRLPQGPTIQFWNLQHGQLESELRLQIPEEDRLLVKPVSRGVQALCFECRLLPHAEILAVSQRLEAQAYSERLRIYDLTSGRCLSQKPISNANALYAWVDGKTSHTFGLCHCFSQKAQHAFVVYNLVSGEPIRIIDQPAKSSLVGFFMPPNGDKLLLLWRIADRPASYQLQLIQFETWQTLTRLEIQNSHNVALYGMDSKNIFLSFEENTAKSRMHTLKIYLINPSSGLIEPDETHVCHGLTSEGGRFDLQAPWLVIVKYPFADSESSQLTAWLEQFLHRAGIRFSFGNQGQSITIFNCQNGVLVRQLTHLTGFSNQVLRRSPDAQHLIGIEVSSNNGLFNSSVQSEQRFLTCYAIPHHLWQPTWNFLFYFSLALLLLWPLRFLLRPRRPIAAP